MNHDSVICVTQSFGSRVSDQSDAWPVLVANQARGSTVLGHAFSIYSLGFSQSSGEERSIEFRDIQTTPPTQAPKSFVNNWVETNVVVLIAGIIGNAIESIWVRLKPRQLKGNSRYFDWLKLFGPGIWIVSPCGWGLSWAKSWAKSWACCEP